MNDIGQVLNKWFSDMAARAQERATNALNEAWNEVKPEIKEKVNEAFRESVDQWYAAYTPSLYHRNLSLYEIMEIQDDADEGAFTFLFDGARMTRDRKGGSLLNKVFAEGWHGGAFDGTTMRYRTPPPGYWRWGRVAVRTTPAYAIFEEKKDALVSIYSKKIADIAMTKAFQD